MVLNGLNGLKWSKYELCCYHFNLIKAAVLPPSLMVSFTDEVRTKEFMSGFLHLQLSPFCLELISQFDQLGVPVKQHT